MFKFADRNKDRCLVLIPGWAFDYRIFTKLDLPYNYFYFCGPSIVNFEDELKKLLEKNPVNKISLLGWSQGAFAACQFACNTPGNVEELILVGTRQKCEKKALEKIKVSLTKNKSAYLYSFYKQCFSENEKDNYRWFKDKLLKDYLDNMSSNYLISCLDYLGQLQIKPELLKKLKRVTLIHGKEDKIAPVNEAIDIANTLPRAQFICFDRAGHLPFLREDFNKHLYEC